MTIPKNISLYNIQASFFSFLYKARPHLHKTEHSMNHLISLNLKTLFYNKKQFFIIKNNFWLYYVDDKQNPCEGKSLGMKHIAETQIMPINFRKQSDDYLRGASWIVNGTRKKDSSLSIDDHSFTIIRDWSFYYTNQWWTTNNRQKKPGFISKTQSHFLSDKEKFCFWVWIKWLFWSYIYIRREKERWWYICMYRLNGVYIFSLFWEGI